MDKSFPFSTSAPDPNQDLTNDFRDVPFITLH